MCTSQCVLYVYLIAPVTVAMVVAVVVIGAAFVVVAVATAGKTQYIQRTNINKSEGVNKN